MIAKVLTVKEELEQAARLRYEVFVEHLQWVPGNPERLERDCHDIDSEQVGVFEGPKLLGVCRITPYGKPWMLTKSFSWYTGPIDPDSFELSRLAVDLTVKKPKEILSRLFYYMAHITTNPWCYTITTHRRVPAYRRMGIIFEELDRHLYDEWAVVIKIDALNTPWRTILERSL